MNETKFENKLAAFFAKVKKLITDYFAYCDMSMHTSQKLAEDAAESAAVARKAVDDILNHNSGSVSISSVTLFADRWVGAESPYSQVVTIDGATEYSKIDINPTPEQLAVFHNKDLAFIPENDEGVITVYCVGQKPTNDYTMQVTMTEVSVGA